MRRIGLAAACAAVAGAATGADFAVRVVDEAGRPVPGAFVIGREFVDVPQLHGSRTYCDRADAAPVAREVHEITLPGAGIGKLAPGRHYALEAFAYAPGYCIDRTPPAHRAAASNALPATWRSGPPAIAAGSETTLRARPAAPGEERLAYLVDFSLALACPAGSWSRRSGASLQQLSNAMAAEANGAAETKYGKLLASQVRRNLAQATRSDAGGPAAPPRAVNVATQADNFVRDFIVAPGHYRVQFPAANAAPGQPAFAIASAGGGTAYGAAQPAARPGAAPGPATIVVQGQTAARLASPGSAGLVIHCRHGAPARCDLDERDAQGKTALAHYAAQLDVEAVGLLVSNGANPSAPSGVSGVDAFETLVARLIMNPPASGSIDAGNAIRILEIMAASPRATVRAGLRAELEAPEAQWATQSPQALAVLRQAREKLRSVRVRPDPAACAPIGDELRHDALPVRLRLR
jgi:hypothetical protein